MNKSRLTKLAHSSFLLQHKKKNIVFDPGNFTIQNNSLHNVDILIITHSHGDHFNIDNIKYINEHTENLEIVTNSEVAELIKELDITTNVVENVATITVDDIKITAHDNAHEEIYKDFNLVQNTGYYIDDIFFHPGDAFTKPNKEIKAIATVIIAPFMRVKTAIDYINNNPKAIHFGVHEGVANPVFAGWLKNIIQNNINSNIEYVHPSENLSAITL